MAFHLIAWFIVIIQKGETRNETTSRRVFDIENPPIIGANFFQKA